MKMANFLFIRKWFWSFFTFSCKIVFLKISNSNHQPQWRPP